MRIRRTDESTSRSLLGESTKTKSKSKSGGSGGGGGSSSSSSSINSGGSGSAPIKPPFYLLDEVDASLDAQHAARAGALMARRAAQERVEYYAISHRPQLFLSASRLVGTYGCAPGASKCVAVDFEDFQLLG